MLRYNMAAIRLKPPALLSFDHNRWLSRLFDAHNGFANRAAP
jgi:hypothetical protein